MSSTTCPACGTSVNATARFCKNCAFDLGSIPSTAEPVVDPTLVTASSPSKASFPLIIAGVIAGGFLLILAIGILGVWLYKRKSVTAANTPPAAPITSATSVSSRSTQAEDKIIRNEPLNDADVSGLSLNELRILRNVHFARYGRKYERPGLGDYFWSRSWYQPRDDFNENMLTDLDKANIKVIQAAEDRTVAAQSRNWETFWTMLREAADRKDRATLTKLMPSDFSFDCCDSYDENKNGDTRDEAFRLWSKAEVNGWAALNNALANGAVESTVWKNPTSNDKQKVAPAAANRNDYTDWIAQFELRPDGRWYFVSFVVPEVGD
jgi:YARHG domain